MYRWPSAPTRRAPRPFSADSAVAECNFFWAATVDFFQDELNFKVTPTERNFPERFRARLQFGNRNGFRFSQIANCSRAQRSVGYPPRRA